MNKKILIITHSADNASVEQVTRHLENMGAEAVRFDVDTYPLQTRLATSFGDDGWQSFLTTGQSKIRIDDISALWYRRAYNMGVELKDVLEPKYLGAAMGEVRAALFGFVESVSCFALGKPSIYRRLDSKEEQLKVAHRLGFNVPKSCITNDPEIARQFVQSLSGAAICKMQSSFAIYEEGVEHVVFTNVINRNNLDSLEDLLYCPMQFQEKLEKKSELRITVVGRKIFAFQIDSQKHPDAKVDWRKDGINLLDQWLPTELPQDLQEKILALMEFYQIHYGAIDMIFTPDGRYYFIEINVAGEYFWLDMFTNDYGISEEIARLLVSEGSKNNKAGYKKLPALC